MRICYFCFHPWCATMPAAPAQARGSTRPEVHSMDCLIGLSWFDAAVTWQNLMTWCFRGIKKDRNRKEFFDSKDIPNWKRCVIDIISPISTWKVSIHRSTVVVFLCSCFCSPQGQKVRLGSGNMQCEMPMAAKPQVWTHKIAEDIAMIQP